MALSAAAAVRTAPSAHRPPASLRRSIPNRKSSHGQTISGMAFLSGFFAFGRRRSCSTQVRAKGGWPQSFVSGDAAQTLREVRWPEEWPYTEVDFSRQDESTDAGFYSQPRICTHVDDSR
eukprot:s2006_g5.t1